MEKKFEWRRLSVLLPFTSLSERTRMRLAELIEGLEVKSCEGNLDSDILDITDDSRNVKQGSLFVAVKGIQMDGHNFVERACAAGAASVLVQSPYRWSVEDAVESGQSDSCPALVQVVDTRKALGQVAAKFFDYPSQQLRMIGVTGTNGKTTVTHVSKAVLETANQQVGVIGTIGYFVGDECVSATHTTPTPIVLQSLLAKMVKRNLNVAVMEVSSHALALDRVAGCQFDIVVFTNLTQDHLDFHEDMEAYFQAKYRLFSDYVTSHGEKEAKRAIVNIDDPWGKRLAQACPIPVWTYGISQRSDIHATGVSLSMEGTAFTAVTPQGSLSILSPLVGEHNVYNLLATIGVGLAMELPLELIRKGIQSAKAVPGRFERIEEGQEFLVVVDYAHTDDALARLLAAAHALEPSRIITVFGCGGDRDRGKRPKMGAVAAEQSDVVLVTSDNPRSEEPLSILQDIERGIRPIPPGQRARYQMIPDRRKAIETAIQEAMRGDIVVIAGKGHEDYQIIGSERHHFDDREVAREALRLRMQGNVVSD
ncbi:MAG: UDP-N-acetylmuramoyl-L-alanyl-D-glutamate--2,6-diaminopimelate ligase [Nitrospirota bacterium]|nr:UDP-N-acetylmuramoyl-L-alanyl-D-glutamate--2,6-diaminopimelate ligase [Nitrospirota bacterium]